MKAIAKMGSLTLALWACVMIDSVAFEEVLGLSDARANKLVLKMERNFIGGEVHLYSGSSTLIISQKMKKRKISIDFSAARTGEYVVRVKKGTKQKEFYYLKK